VFRLALLLVALLAVAVGLVVGTLNSSTVTVDLLWVELHWPLGLVLLSACFIGMLLGLSLAWFFSILPLRARLRRLAASAPKDTLPARSKDIDG